MRLIRLLILITVIIISPAFSAAKYTRNSPEIQPVKDVINRALSNEYSHSPEELSFALCGIIVYSNIVKDSEYKSEAVIRCLLAAGADINMKNPTSQTALIAAVHLQDDNAARLLLEHNADPDLADKNGCTALYYAIKMGTPVVEDLLLAGANPEIANHDGVNPYQLALSKRSLNSQNIAIMEKYHPELKIKYGSSAANNSGNNSNNTASQENIEFLRKRIKEIDNPSFSSQDATDLMGFVIGLPEFADFYDPQDIIEKLISKGADVNATYTKDNLPALLIALICHKTRIFNILLESGANPNQLVNNQSSILNIAIKDNILSAVESLLKAGADIYLPDNTGISPFTSAYIFNNEIIIGLIEKYTNNSLSITEQEEKINKEILKSVINSIIATPHKLDKDFMEELFVKLATNKPQLDLSSDVISQTINIIIDSGFSVNKKHSFGSLPLDLAVKSQNIIIAKVLLERGADPDSNASTKGYPLYLAVSQNNAKLTRMLLEAGADMNTVQNNGTTSYQLAKSEPAKYAAVLPELEKFANR